ncbi:MAG: hypothetical protein HYS65_13545 [Betaproteobacteria bacterium]|nr:hypothetical protein [Betaproteobacteria bacterium]
MLGKLVGTRGNHDQFELAGGQSRCVGRLRRRLDIHDQAVLAARHRKIDRGQQIGVEQRAMQRARRVVDLVAFAERVQVVFLARVQLARHLQRIDDVRAIFTDRFQVEQIELAVQKPGVERRVVDDQFGAAHEVEPLVDDVAELRLVAQEFLAQSVHLQRAFVARALRVDVAVKMIAAQAPVDDLDRRELDHTVAKIGIEAGGFSVENDLPHKAVIGDW